MIHWVNPFRWMPDDRMRRWHWHADRWLSWWIAAAVLIGVLTLTVWEPFVYLLLLDLLIGVVAFCICRLCWHEVDRRNYDPLEWFKGIR